MEGHTDLTLGHVSARSSDGGVFIKCKDIGLDEVTPEDILRIDMDCNKVAGQGGVHLEAFMHTEVYRARDDVDVVIHTHPLYTTALSGTSAQLAFVNHDGLLFQNGLGMFDETAELIMSSQQGKAVAHALGNCRAILLKNHGVLVVGRDLPWAVYTAITLERAVKVQTIATMLGPLQPIPSETAKRMVSDKFRDEFIESYWRYLTRKAHRCGFDAGMP